MANAGPGTAKAKPTRPSAEEEKRHKKKTKDKEAVEALAEGTEKLVNQGSTKVPSKETGERADDLRRWPDSDYSSSVEQDMSSLVADWSHK